MLLILLLLSRGLTIRGGLVLVILFSNAVKSEILWSCSLLSRFIFFLELIDLVLVAEREVVQVGLIVIKIKDLLLRMRK